MFDPTRYSAFREMQRIKNDLYDAGKDETDFSRWLHNGLIHPLNTVRDIPKILKNKEATNVFLKDGAREATKYLDAVEIRDPARL